MDARSEVDPVPAPSCPAPTPDARAAPAPVEAVTPREAEVLQLVTDGCSTVEVARRLSVSQKTVKNHLVSIYATLGVSDPTQAVRKAVELGVVELR